MFPQANALIGQAIHHFKSGSFDEAKKKLTYVLNLQPKNIAALELLGIIFASQGDSRQAFKHFEKITKIKPDYAEAWCNRGNSLLEQKKYEQALASYDKAIGLKPDLVDAWSNRGVALQGLNQNEQALISIDKALSLRPDFLDAWSNRGAALQKLKQYEQALACFEKAVSINPGSAKLWSNRGEVLKDLRQYENALDSFDKALSIDSGYANAWSNRGNVLQKLKLYDQALSSYENALKTNPNNASARWNKSLLELLSADFESGWSNYECRWLREGTDEMFHQEIPRLTSLAKLERKNVLVWWEQGYGDTIQFSRYVSELSKLGARVFFEVQSPLKTLLAHSFPEVKVISRDESVEGIDYQVPLISLPGLFATNLANLPTSDRYLKPTLECSVAWSEKLILSKAKLNIGIACSGSETHSNDENRSMALSYFEPLINWANIFLIQKDLREHDRGFLNTHPEIKFLGHQISSFDDSAAIVDQMDLVITVDTSLAHLAGALGRPAMVLLPWAPEWRWMLDRLDSPWYPSIRLIRQARDGDWGSVIQGVLAVLKSDDVDH